jgi:hypothetical protein
MLRTLLPARHEKKIVQSMVIGRADTEQRRQIVILEDFDFLLDEPGTVDFPDQLWEPQRIQKRKQICKLVMDGAGS